MTSALIYVAGPSCLGGDQEASVPGPAHLRPGVPVSSASPLLPFPFLTHSGFFCSLSSQVFLSYTEAGSIFVFGEALVKDVFAFQVS
jgi:hypothetical protein